MNWAMIDLWYISVREYRSQTGDRAFKLEKVQIFILAEGLKIDFLALSGRESSLVQTFRESCVHFSS